MNAAELIAKAKTIVEEGYPDSTWEGMIESVLSDLNPVAKMMETIEITPTIVDGYCEIDISSDISELYEIVIVSFKPTGKRKQTLRKLPPYDGVSLGWVRENNKIKIQNLPGTGTVIVDYYAVLTMTVSGGDKIFNLPEEHHDVILKGLLATVAQKEEELDRKNDFFGEYMMAKRELMAKRVQEMEPWYAQVVAPTRLGGQ